MSATRYMVAKSLSGTGAGANPAIAQAINKLKENNNVKYIGGGEEQKANPSSKNNTPNSKQARYA